MPNVVSLRESEPRGIVIKSGAAAPKPVRCWAYVWAADDGAPQPTAKRPRA